MKLDDLDPNLIHRVTGNLSLISSCAQYVLGKLAPDSGAREELETIRAAAEQAAEMLREIESACERPVAAAEESRDHGSP